MHSAHTIGTEALVPQQAIGVLVVDDQQAVREGVALLIDSVPTPLRTVGIAATAAEGLRLAALLRPQVVVLDADLAGEDGLAMIPLLAQGAAVLVLTCHGDAATRARATQLGARAFVEKYQPAAYLLGAILQIATPQVRGEKAPSAEGESTQQLAGASSAVRGTGAA
jgi:two-component system, NarL family, nitrate/nitrite response regulator NarL